METRNIIKELREKKKMTQDQLAGHLMVTRQAVSRWENGETQPAFIFSPDSALSIFDPGLSKAERSLPAFSLWRPDRGIWD